MGRRYVPGSRHFKATQEQERRERQRLESLGISEGTCEGCYQEPCICLADGADCDPNEEEANDD